MHFGKDFWATLHALAIHLEHLPGDEDQRRQSLVDAWSEFGPMGREAALEEVQLAVTELTALERKMERAGKPVASGGRS